ncbi:hypothetical protein EV401DRAFT_1948410 [Pisolithus croceorrhizus]|nr:hypothetical protein EV401DRAFT_1948410 [Pisolithus croceorrhizus]
MTEAVPRVADHYSSLSRRSHKQRPLISSVSFVRLSRLRENLNSDVVGGRSYWQVSLLYRTYSDPTESFTGLTVGLALYGVSACQYLLYVPTFRNDKRLLKSVVRNALDTLNTITLTSFYCRSLIFCRWNTSYTCTLEMPCSPFRTKPISLQFTTAFFVQCFYAHRVWIIGNRNKFLTGAVLIAALVQFGFGVVRYVMACLNQICIDEYAEQFSPVNALGSAICDAIITTSIYFYLRSSRAGLLWKDNYIQKLNFVFVRMGYYYDQKSGSNLTTAPGAILGKTYANSMLAVLNARKGIRDRQQAQALPLEVPTLPSIH